MESIEKLIILLKLILSLIFWTILAPLFDFENSYSNNDEIHHFSFLISAKTLSFIHLKKIDRN